MYTWAFRTTWIWSAAIGQAMWWTGAVWTKCFVRAPKGVGGCKIINVARVVEHTICKIEHDFITSGGPGACGETLRTGN